MNFKKYIADKINVDMDKQQLAEFVTPTAEGAFGDFAFPCFRLAKTLRSSPIAIAEKLQSEIVPDEVIEKAEAVNGYLNFYLRKQKTCTEAIGRILPDEHYGSSNEGEGKTICIDYSSVNIAKPFHIGHLSTTAIGSSLYKLYKFLGYNVIGINHLGDWGTQFGKLIVAYKLWSNKDAVEKGGVDELQRIYVKFHIEEESNAQLTTEAREWFSRIEKGDVEAQELLEFFKRITLTEVEKIYKRLNVEFDSWNGESFYNDKMQPILDLLTQKGLVTTSEGAKIVDLTE
ncbi:MAG: arginine--tRNA ligase, partial [Clostridia bacterium]